MQQFFKSVTEGHQITGALILYKPDLFIHVLEATEDIILSYLQFQASIVSEMRILSSVDNLETRWFPFWFTRSIDIKVDALSQQDEEDVKVADAETILSFASDLAKSSRKLGDAVSQLARHAIKSTLDDFANSFKTLIPSRDTVKQMVSSSHILSEREWISVFVQA